MDLLRDFIETLNETFGFNVIFGVMVLGMLLMLVFSVVFPLIRLLLGVIKNFFLRKKNVPKKLPCTYDKTKSTATGEFTVVNTEKKKIEYLKTLQQGDEIILDNNKFIVVTNNSSAKPIARRECLKRKLFYWDRLEFTIHFKNKLG